MKVDGILAFLHYQHCNTTKYTQNLFKRNYWTSGSRTIAIIISECSSTVHHAALSLFRIKYKTASTFVNLKKNLFQKMVQSVINFTCILFTRFYQNIEVFLLRSMAASLK